MKVALSIFNGRISPVFDVSRRILLLELRNDGVIAREEASFEHDEPMHKTSRLAELKVDTLICGAISRPLASAFSACGIKVISFIAGDIQEVINAFMSDGLPAPELTMPGCRRQGRRQRCSGKQDDREDHHD
ncbi:MAG: NifB/NifX family molybdenum-iron cluster-binding protein [Syntrophaceae bacterium]|nr:dinitrogenase iron-molybdenum cofactor biosynthesis protein [Deltaproteobacteria bacterium]